MSGEPDLPQTCLTRLSLTHSGHEPEIMWGLRELDKPFELVLNHAQRSGDYRSGH